MNAFFRWLFRMTEKPKDPMQDPDYRLGYADGYVAGSIEGRRSTLEQLGMTK